MLVVQGNFVTFYQKSVPCDRYLLTFLKTAKPRLKVKPENEDKQMRNIRSFLSSGTNMEPRKCMSFICPCLSLTTVAVQDFKCKSSCKRKNLLRLNRKSQDQWTNMEPHWYISFIRHCLSQITVIGQASKCRGQRKRKEA